MSTEPPTIVVVDDDHETVTFLRDFFDMLGMVVVTCSDGAQAPACTAKHHPAVVILDVYLEGMTGVDVLRQLRAQPTTQDIPVVFFSGSGDYLRRLLPDLAAHGASLVVKPDIEQLSAVVQRLVQQST